MTGRIPEVPPVRHGSFEPFWQATEDGVLRLPRCPSCRRWLWYPQATCGACGAVPVWEEVRTEGTVFSFTVVHRSFLPQGAVEAPYTVALVELDGVPGPRLVAPTRDGARVTVGQRVRIGFERFETHVLPVVEPIG